MLTSGLHILNVAGLNPPHGDRNDRPFAQTEPRDREFPGVLLAGGIPKQVYVACERSSGNRRHVAAVVGFFVRPFSAVSRHRQARLGTGCYELRSTRAQEVTEMPRTRPEPLYK